MKKIVSAILVAAICLLLVSGCSDSGKYFDYDVNKYIQVGEISGIEYEEQSSTVTDADVQSYIEYELGQKAYGEEKEITNRPVKNGDTVNIDFVGKKDGVAFEGGTAQGHDLVIGSNSFIEGFESGLIGVQKGETVDLDLKFPENYDNEELKGAAVVFTVTVNSIKTTVYPELTDEIVKDLSEDCSTVEEYKTFVTEMLVEYNKQMIDSDNR